ncbi:MAG: IS982 family transposase [Flavobacteriales bacterium]|nr:IS982 family transposase [Flavobacteriales bacterium]
MKRYDFHQVINKILILPYQRRKPKLLDLELISLNLTAEYLGFDSETDLFRKLPISLSSKIERSVYNRRKRKQFPYIELIRSKLSHVFNEFEDYYIVDSMPLEICKLSRSSRSKICKEELMSQPNKGYYASQKSRYYGYKLHGICSVKGVFKSIDISPASVHDINYLKDIQHQISDCTLIGDRGYLSTEYQLNLFETANIKLDVPMRINQDNYKKQPYVFRKSRKRIETLFSQLCDQFMIRRNYAKSFEGFKTRILSKITSLTIIQYINKFVFDRNINNIKTSII